MRANLAAMALTVATFVTALSGISSPALALDLPTDGMDLLARVKTLVDKGELFDPVVVARTIPGDRPITAVDVYQKGMCQAGLQKDIRSTRWTLTAWFHNMPTGSPNLPYRAVGPFGHSGITGDPAGSYLLMDEEYCSDLLHLPDERSASLRFDNLPGFSCLTMDQVSSVMPVTDDHATDGGGIYSYSPPAHREYGTRVTFYFGGSQCLAGISAEQNRIWGTRYINAEQAFRQCTDVADHKFCAANPPFVWGDGHMQDLMSVFSAKECKGFGLYYREMRTPKPRPQSAHVRTTPCDGK